MNRTLRLLAVALATVALFSPNLHAQSTAVEDPQNQDARMYLAKSYAKQYEPGVDTPENTRLAERAIEQYQSLLDGTSNGTLKIDSAKGIAELYFQMNKFTDSKTYVQWASDLDPNNPELYYVIGRIDLILSKNSDQNEGCNATKAKNTLAIEEGINSLNRAIDLRPTYDGAMFYLNLLYREKASLECDDPATRAADLKTADEWVDKANLPAASDSSGETPSLIPPGMRAVSVRVNDTTSVSGFVRGTRVDVMVTENPQGSNEQQTTTILRNVPVIATGQRGELRSHLWDEAEGAPVVTLLASPDDAERLALASQVGHIQLVPRN